MADTAERKFDARGPLIVVLGALIGFGMRAAIKLGLVEQTKG